MKCSKSVLLTMFFVLLVSACADDCNDDDEKKMGQRACVDEHGVVVDESLCAGLPETVDSPPGASASPTPDVSSPPQAPSSAPSGATQSSPSSSPSSTGASASASSSSTVASGGAPPEPATIGPPLPPAGGGSGDWGSSPEGRTEVREVHTDVHHYHHSVGPRVFWYYHSGPAYSPGVRVSGGSFSPSPGRSYASPGGRVSTPTISRGVIGGGFRGAAPGVGA